MTSLRRIPFWSIVVAILCLPAAGVAGIFQSGNYIFNYSTIDYPGMQDSLAYSINNLGQVAGYYSDPVNTGGADRGFTYKSTTFSTQNVTSAYSTDLYGINDSGTVVGSYYTQSATTVNSLLISGGSQQLPGSAQTEYYGINDAGAVVGSTHSGNSSSGFFQMGATTSLINVPTAMGTFPHGVNSSNAVVGFSETNSGIYSGFLTTPGCQTSSCFTLIAPAGSSSSFAYGINDAGYIVGVSENASGVYQGFLFNGASYTLLNIPGAIDTFAAGINDQNQIVGWYESADGNYHAFETTATLSPEPLMGQALAIMTLPILAWFAIRSNRRKFPKRSAAGGLPAA